MLPQIPENLQKKIDDASDSSSVKDLTRLAVGLAQARAAGQDTFKQATKIQSLLEGKTGQPDPTHALIGLKQAKLAASSSDAGLFTVLKNLESQEEIEAWLETDSFTDLAEAFEDVAAVCSTPDMAAALEAAVARWESAAAGDPDSPGYATRLEVLRRIGDAYFQIFCDSSTVREKKFAAWHDRLAMVLAKHKSVPVDAETAYSLLLQVEQNVAPILASENVIQRIVSDPNLVEALVNSPVLMSVIVNNLEKIDAWMDSPQFVEALTAVNDDRQTIGFSVFTQNLFGVSSLLISDAFWDKAAQHPNLFSLVVEDPNNLMMTVMQFYGKILAAPNLWELLADKPDFWNILSLNQNVLCYLSSREWFSWILEHNPYRLLSIPNILSTLQSSGYLQDVLGNEAALDTIFGDPRVASQVTDYDVWNTVCASENPKVWKHIGSYQFYSLYLSNNYNHVVDSMLDANGLRFLDAVGDAEGINVWREIWNNASVFQKIISSDVLLRKFLTLETARSTFYYQHNALFQSMVYVFYNTVSSSDKFHRADSYVGGDVDVLNEKAAKYPNSLIFATVGSGSGGGAMRMCHPQEEQEAIGFTASKEPVTRFEQRCLSFTGAKFEKIGDGQAAIEIWQAV